MLDAATGTLYNVEFATGFIRSNYNGGSYCGDASRMYIGQGFKVPETQTVANVWVKIRKDGNPTDNLGAYIYSDNGSGKPNALIANGTATALSGKLFANDAGWYRFNFATPPSLTAGTQYHLVLKRSGAADGSNIYAIYTSYPNGTSTEYPWGFYNNADNTPTWAATSTDRQMAFLVELSDSAKILQTSGAFDGKLAFGGSGASGVLSMSRGLVSTVPLVELYGDMTEFTCYRSITGVSKDSTVFDIGYGENHDRAVFRCNITTGYGSINVYKSDGTLTTVTATATDLSSGTHSVGWYIRAKNDGADRIDLFIDGTTYSSATNLSISFDKALPLLGCEYVGGGFALAPTYSGSSIGINGFSGLPSTLGWTYAGSATQANLFSVSGGKLYQNKNGDTGSQDGYYTIAWAASNANGHNVAKKFRVVSSDNADTTVPSVALVPQDGTKRQYAYTGEYYTKITATTNYLPQADFKSADVVLHMIAKGSDGFVFLNRKMLVDNSGNPSATATNSLDFGDYSAGASARSDVIYSYMNYYTTAWSPPQFTTGSINEYINWQGNMKAMWPLLYNAGTQISGKTYMGIGANYLDKSGRIAPLVQRGITSQPTTTSTTSTPVPELEAYVMAERFEASANGPTRNDSLGDQVFLGIVVDGSLYGTENMSEAQAASRYGPNNVAQAGKTYLGLHKMSASWRVTANTGSNQTTRRTLIVEPKL